MESAQSSDLFALLLQRLPDGRPAFQEAELEHAMPLLFITLVQSVGFEAAPAPVRSYLTGFAERIGFDARGGAESMSERIAAYYAAEPINPHLLRALRRFFAEAGQTGIEDAAQRAFAS